MFASELAQDELGNERQRVPKTDHAVWITFVFAGAKTRRCWAGRLHAVGRSKAGRPTRDNGHGKTFTLLQGGGKGATTKTKKGKKIIAHEDGDDGEVFVASYFNRRIPKKWKVDNLKSLFDTRE